MALLTDTPRLARRPAAVDELILGSVASLAANIAVADPPLWSRAIHVWPSFALMGAFDGHVRPWSVSGRARPFGG
ncbi:hypothetical protein HDA32_000571 [Spinactinospora alkalitolerans]|uniref:Uncharacterized protein n=1 Tax=Spinactinospora alkalitolerans TaxID=687207 RepID=A0A852TPP1_9ACTN|nr:hypothetical protein [Spinactinospora alkalitolerans]NYE45451.1 hypothetical protein [Spinactinospora alkalitolerans]